MDHEPSAQEGSHAVTGFIIGVVVAAVLWVIPIPVAMIVWIFHLKGLFADYMYMAIPYFLMIPPAGAFIGSLIGQKTEPR